MDYSQVLSYLASLQQEHQVLEKKHFSLRGMRCALKLFGNPEKKLKVIHVAGSKGKGSVSAMMASILKEAGFRVGLYTSPHLYDVRERIRLNGRMISKKDFSIYAEKISHFVSGLSYFEILTLLAILYFVHQKADYAVFEVGLGGRLDATNAVSSVATVLTPVEKEHTALLGTTVLEIAWEKLGIVKAGIPLFVAPQKHGVISLAKKVCEQKKSRCILFSEYVSYSIVSRRLKDYRFRAKIGRRDIVSSSALLGDHQTANACLAVLVIDNLMPGFPDSVLSSGLKKVKWPVRFEYVRVKGVRVIFDVAHTIESIKAFLTTYVQLFGDMQKVYVLSFFRDKPVFRIMSVLEDGQSCFVFTSSNSPRAFRASDLSKKFPKLQAVSIENPRQAFEYACTVAGKRKACVCVLGSFGHIGEIRELEN